MANTSYNPQDLETSNFRLFQIAVPLNRYDEVMSNIFKFMARTGIEKDSIETLSIINKADIEDDIKMLSDIHWSSLSPEAEELERLRVKNARFAVDFTDKLQIRDEVSGTWKGTLYVDPTGDIVISFDPTYWLPEMNFGRYNPKSYNRGILMVYQEDTNQDFINVGILTIPAFRCWAFEVLAYISYGNYVYTDICDDFKFKWVLEDIRLINVNQ